MDRATIYRDGMEPEALVIIEEELARRGITGKALAEYNLTMEKDCLRSQEGFVVQCCLCRKPAMAEGWGWYRIFWIPIIPRRMKLCAEHLAEFGPDKCKPIS
jgi:hypothetical protein